MENPYRLAAGVGPHQMFIPIHLPWLYRRREQGLDVTAADLDSIEQHQPDAANDPLFAHCRALAAAGKLHRRRGRKPMTRGGRGMLWAAFFAIEEQKARIWAERRTGGRVRMRGEESPVHEAAELVARRFRFGSGRSLLNRVSRERIPGNY